MDPTTLQPATTRSDSEVGPPKGRWTSRRRGRVDRASACPRLPERKSFGSGDRCLRRCALIIRRTGTQYRYRSELSLDQDRAEDLARPPSVHKVGPLFAAWSTQINPSDARGQIARYTVPSTLPKNAVGVVDGPLQCLCSVDGSEVDASEVAEVTLRHHRASLGAVERHNRKWKMTHAWGRSVLSTHDLAYRLPDRCVDFVIVEKRGIDAQNPSVC